MNFWPKQPVKCLFQSHVFHVKLGSNNSRLFMNIIKRVNSDLTWVVFGGFTAAFPFNAKQRNKVFTREGNETSEIQVSDTKWNIAFWRPCQSTLWMVSFFLLKVKPTHIYLQKFVWKWDGCQFKLRGTTGDIRFTFNTLGSVYSFKLYSYFVKTWNFCKAPDL